MCSNSRWERPLEIYGLSPLKNLKVGCLLPLFLQKQESIKLQYGGGNIDLIVGSLLNINRDQGGQGNLFKMMIIKLYHLALQLRKITSAQLNSFWSEKCSVDAPSTNVGQQGTDLMVKVSEDALQRKFLCFQMPKKEKKLTELNNFRIERAEAVGLFPLFR